MKILITGAGGFVAKELIQRLSSTDNELTGTFRHRKPDLLDIQLISLGDISGDTDWQSVVFQKDVVIHTAGRAHMINDPASDKLYEFRKVNYYGTINLATQAAAAGVKRFIFISTIGVNGNETKDSFFDESKQPEPHSPYAVSKYEAEVKLKEIERDTGLEVVIIRPPLICGPDAPGNLERLFKLVNKISILPFGLANNKRSIVSLQNLVDFIYICLTHPKAKGEVFTIADDEVISTKEMIKVISGALGKSCSLLPIPPSLIGIATKILRRESMYQQLFGNLVVKNTKAKELLDWSPIVTSLEALDEAARKSILNIK